MPTDTLTTLTQREFNALKHPNEDSRFVLALAVCIPAVIVGLVLLFMTRGIAVIFVGGTVAAVWFGLRVFQAHLIGSSVRVSEENFPQIHVVVEEVRRTLDYDRPVRVYIIEEGSVNAILHSFFRTKFIMLHAGLAEEMISGDGLVQMRWIVARFIGALKAKHFRVNLLRVLVMSIEYIKIFNLFLLPYERATQYTGDQIGLAVCGRLPSSMQALNKLLVGNKLARDVQLSGLLRQSSDLHRSFFGWFAQLMSTHPHMTNRYLNLLGFASQSYPEQFVAFVTDSHRLDVNQVYRLMPRHHTPANLLAAPGARTSVAGKVGASEEELQAGEGEA